MKPTKAEGRKRGNRGVFVKKSITYWTDGYEFKPTKSEKDLIVGDIQCLLIHMFDIETGGG